LNRNVFHNLNFDVYRNVSLIHYIYMSLYHHVMLDVLHDRDLCLLFVYNIYVLQFRILVDRYNLFYYNMMRSCVEYCDGYDHVLFHAMYEIHQQVFDYELM